MVLCKDAKGKCGVSFHAASKGVFVCFVQKNSPAAMGGVRFGDQILTVSLGGVRYQIFSVVAMFLLEYCCFHSMGIVYTATYKSYYHNNSAGLYSDTSS